MQKVQENISSILVVFFLLFSFSLIPTLSYAIENDDCLDCHGDDSMNRSESKGIKQGVFVDDEQFKYSRHNINGITCVDCHSDIEELNYDDEVPHPVALRPVECGECHDVEAEAYLNSVHSKAGGKGINIPCYACHEYHYTVRLAAASVAERENSFCKKCHDPGKFHEWLPQAQTHFDFVECTVCHATDAPRHIHLRFFNLYTNEFMDGTEILAALETDYESFMELVDADKDGIIGRDEFESIVVWLRQRERRVVVHGELVSDLEPDIHKVNRGEANRECEMCHMPTSPFFESVTIALVSDDRVVHHYQVARDVLQTYHVSHFYALGGTRVRILDKIGLALIVGGMGVVFAHLLARIFTMPLRRKKRKQY